MNDGTPSRPARNVELGASGEEFQNLHEFVRKARTRLNQNAWDYIVGASETETTMRRNRMALDELHSGPGAAERRPGRRVDRSIRLPPAPAGHDCAGRCTRDFDPDSGAAVARGAGQFGAAQC